MSKNYKQITLFFGVILLVFITFNLTLVPSFVWSPNRGLNNTVLDLFKGKVQSMISSPPISKYTIITNWSFDSNNPMMTTKNSNNSFEIKINPSQFIGTRSDTGKNEITTDFVKIVLSHEASHIISLQDKELKTILDPNNKDRNLFLKNESICNPNYFNLNGCFEDNSLINKFYTKFWTGEMLLEYNQIQNKTNLSNDEFQKNLSNWGDKYKDNFITTRSIENPEEDLAEIVSYWITDINQNKTITPIIKEKIKFVESQSELVQFKKEFNDSFNKIFEPAETPEKN
jgi:hypothetical protein